MAKLACMDKDETFLTIREVIEMLGVSHSRFYKVIRIKPDFPEVRTNYYNKHIDVFRRHTNPKVYVKAEIEEWLKNNDITSRGNIRVRTQYDLWAYELAEKAGLTIEEAVEKYARKNGRKDILLMRLQPYDPNEEYPAYMFTELAKRFNLSKARIADICAEEIDEMWMNYKKDLNS